MSAVITSSDLQLRAFHGDPSIKEKYLARVRAHREADNLIQGTGWRNGKGCAVGCTLEAYDHSRYPIELGLPEWLARLEDSIFERLPSSDAKPWPESFLAAITPGANVEPVRHKLAMRRIDRLIALQTKALEAKHPPGVHEAIGQTIAALAQVRRCHEAEAQGVSCNWPAARSAARSAAWSAAWSAAAESAESAAESAWAAAWSAAWKQEASDLLELLRDMHAEAA